MRIQTFLPVRELGRAFKSGRWSCPVVLVVASLLPLYPARANTPPVLGEAGPIITPEDQPVTNVVIRVADAESPPEELTLSLVTFSRLGSITLGGQGTERWLNFTPRPNSNGIEVVRLQLRDPQGATSLRDLVVYVLPVNDPPAMDPVPTLTLWAGQPEVSVPVGVRDVDNPPATLNYSVESSHPEIRPRFEWQDTGARLTVPSPPPHLTGHFVLTLKVSDGEHTAVQVCLLEIPSPLFTLVSTNNAGRVEAVLDLDADGWLDAYLAPTNVGTPASGLVRLARPATAEPAVVALPTGHQALTWGDFDGDGLLDALAVNYPTGLTGSPMLQLLRTKRTSTNTVQFTVSTLPFQFRPGTRITAGPAADLDGDGDLDVLFAATGVGTNWVLLNDGAPGFTVSHTGLPPQMVPAALSDLDEDGDVDVLGLEPGSNLLTRPQVAVLYAHDGDGRFSLLARGPQLTNAVAAGAVDLDGDGRLEIWVQVQAEPTRTRGVTQALFLYRRNGPLLTEVARVDLLSDRHLSTPLPVAWADFNLDGLADLLTLAFFPSQFASSAPALPLIYLNQGNQRLSRYEGAGVWAAVPVGRRLWPGDFNGDGKPDFVNSLTNAHHLWHNVAPSAPAPPLLPPERLQVRNFGPVLWFGWEPSPDLAGRPAPTYNLRVGTRPGGQDVVPAHALPDGRRLLVAPGNAGTSRQFWLRLPRPPAGGRLYWSVQVVDAAYRGGLFAPEQSLVLGLPENAPPQISPIPDVVLNEDETREIEFTVSDDHTPPELLVAGAVASNYELFPIHWHARVLGPTAGEPPAVRRLWLSPWPNQWGEAEVRVVVFDEAGLSSSRTVRVTVLPRADFPETRLTAHREGPYLRIDSLLDPYSIWEVEVSTNLVDWTPVQRLKQGNQPAHTLYFSRDKNREFFRLRQIR